MVVGDVAAVGTIAVISSSIAITSAVDVVAVSICKCSSVTSSSIVSTSTNSCSLLSDSLHASSSFASELGRHRSKASSSIDEFDLRFVCSSLADGVSVGGGVCVNALSLAAIVVVDAGTY